MKELSLALTNQEIRSMFVYFDTDSSGDLTYKEFVTALVGDMPQERYAHP